MDVATLLVMPGLLFGAEAVRTPQTWVVATDVTTVDGRVAPFIGIGAGDTIKVTAGRSAALNFRNFAGTYSRPVIIINDGGQVVIDTGAGWYGVYFQNCQHIHMTGTGDPGVTYGFRVARANENGIIFQNKTEYLEIDHCDFYRINGASQIYIQGQTVSTTDPDYDYDGDGELTAADLVTRDNFTQHSVTIHHCNFDGGLGTNYCQMAIYIGNSNYHDANPPNPLCEDVIIHDNLFQNVTNKVCQVGSVVSGMDIYKNTIRRGSQGVYPTEVSNPLGFSINPGCNGKIHDNLVIDTPGHGIGYRGCGGLIYNNIIVRPGAASGYFTAGISVTYPGGYSFSADTHIFNNTIIDPTGNCIEFGHGFGSNRIQNNILVNPAAGSQYIALPAGTFVQGNNYKTLSKAEMYFTDVATDDYSLSQNSPAIGYGTDISAFGVTTDYIGTARPQFTTFDAGAYESLNDYVEPPHDPVLFNITHELNNLAEYSLTNGTVAASAAAAMGGTNYGMAVTIAGVGSQYGRKNFSTSHEGKFGAFFRFDPNSVTMGADDAFTLFVAYTSGGAIAFYSQFQYIAGYYWLTASAAIAGGDANSSANQLTDAAHTIEFYLERAATDVSADGKLEIWIDDTKVETVSGLDNFTEFPDVNSIIVGAASTTAATSGVIYIDEVTGRDDGAHIG